MRWDDASGAIITALAADSALTTALGGAYIIRNGEHNEFRVPLILWTVIWNRIDENTEPFLMQFDVYAKNINQYIEIERRMRRLLHRDIPQTIGGIPMFTQFEDARDHASVEDVIHRSLDFRFEPARAVEA
jgi:hypothetical protein